MKKDKPLLNDSPTREYRGPGPTPDTRGRTIKFEPEEVDEFKPIPIPKQVDDFPDVYAGQRAEAEISTIEQCFDLYPEMMDEYCQIELEQRELFCKKMLDYGTANISVGTELKTPEDRKVSLTGLWYRCNDKISRLKNLVVLNNKPNVKDETLEDTYKDLSIYGIISQLVCRNKWGK